MPMTSQIRAMTLASVLAEMSTAIRIRAPATGATTCLTTSRSESARFTQKYPTTEAWSSTNATSAPTSTTETRMSRPSSRAAARTARATLPSAVASTPTMGTPVRPLTAERPRGRRPLRPMSIRIRAAAARPTMAENEAPRAFAPASSTCSQGAIWPPTMT